MKYYYCAIDVGTTTVAVNIIDQSGIVVARSGFLNPQKRFGTDVISRITNSKKKDNLFSMRDILLRDLEQCITSLIEECIVSDEAKEPLIPAYIKKMCISANTVMAAIILGKDISEMGTAPFPMPFRNNEIIRLFDVETMILAGASAFLGGDSISGAYFLNLSDGDILMDLGTNGEIILRNNGKYHAATAACGPAFENCTRRQNINASTSLSAISNAIKRRQLRKDGVFTEEFLAHGLDTGINGTSFHLTADIIHDIQLAISALYSTLILLMQDTELRIENVNTLYISGGFGFHMNLSDGAGLGLFPYALLPKTVISGNTSLLGACKVLTECDSITAFEKLRNDIILHQFAGDDRYQDLFVQNLVLYRR